ncbi:hypothetical protein L1987_26245 [Smallanthus sonchifolius]|uniref:Uncharacterized protein n=1 Tax=Smallanthus sonchifolius TaxID=185202 RepID=A0ACB9IAR6_9ASTR|nr:hypothetical protein L1987_26245 [Smallanthus sonchifolius]
MISAMSWVPKGASKPVPSVADPPSKQEIQEVKKLFLRENGVDVESAEGDEDNEDTSVDASKQPAEIEQASGAANALGKKASGSSFLDIADGLDELNMDDYDDEDDVIDILGKGIGDTFYPSNELDPYLKDANDDDSEEDEDMVIKSDDAVVVCARVNNEKGHLLACDCNRIFRLSRSLYFDVLIRVFKQVYLIEDSDGASNSYVRHHIDINDFPLCTAWLDCPIRGGEKGNFIAVGSMDPGIEIWDLDTIDEAEPALTLGGVVEEKKKKKGKKVKKSIKYKEDSHTGPVLALAWNKGYRNILASGGGDKTVKIWDVTTGKGMEGFLHILGLSDLLASLENGTVVCFDIRTAMSNTSTELKPKFTLHAHDKNVCAISYNPLVPNLLATGSEDKMVKLWDFSDSKPSCIASQNRNAVRAVFSMSFSEDCPFFLAIAGSKGKLMLWDISLDAGISKRYGKYTRQNKAPAFT